MEKGTTSLLKESAFQKLICPSLVICPSEGAGISLSAGSESSPRFAEAPCSVSTQNAASMVFDISAHHSTVTVVPNKLVVNDTSGFADGEQYRARTKGSETCLSSICQQASSRSAP
jgi:hypothetical protein